MYRLPRTGFFISFLSSFLLPVSQAAYAAKPIDFVVEQRDALKTRVHDKGFSEKEGPLYQRFMSLEELEKTLQGPFFEETADYESVKEEVSATGEACHQIRTLLDLGSATIKYATGEVDICAQPPRIIKDFPKASGKETFHLASKIGKDGRISKETVDSLGRVIQSIQDTVSSKMGTPKIYWAGVATAAIRDSQNRDEVISALKIKTGMKILPISQREEAELGVSTALGLVLKGYPSHYGSPTGIFDFGGGSIQFIALLRPKESTSVPIEDEASPLPDQPVYLWGKPVGSNWFKSILTMTAQVAGRPLGTIMPIAEQGMGDNMVQYLINSATTSLSLKPPASYLKEQIQKLKIFAVSRGSQYSVLPLVNPAGTSFTFEQLIATLVNLSTKSIEEIKMLYPQQYVKGEDPANDFANMILVATVMNLLGIKTIEVLPLESSLQSALSVLKNSSWSNPNQITWQELLKSEKGN